MHGNGRFTFADGDVYCTVYEGDWPDDDQHGRGRITRRSGNTYEEDIRSMFANAFASAMSSGKREWITGVWKYE